MMTFTALQWTWACGLATESAQADEALWSSCCAAPASSRLPGLVYDRDTRISPRPSRSTTPTLIPRISVAGTCHPHAFHAWAPRRPPSLASPTLLFTRTHIQYSTRKATCGSGLAVHFLASTPLCVLFPLPDSLLLRTIHNYSARVGSSGAFCRRHSLTAGGELRLFAAILTPSTLRNWPLLSIPQSQKNSSRVSEVIVIPRDIVSKKHTFTI